MPKLHVKDRDIVVPGDLLADGMDYLPSGKAYREENKIYASAIGLVSIKGRIVKVIPLAGKYMPNVNDVVIGKITNTTQFGWHVDINSPYSADLHVIDATSDYVDLQKVDISKYFNIGDYVLAGIYKFTESKFAKLTAKNRPYRKLRDGTLIEVSPSKIPRIIGKQGSMISMLKNLSGCDVVVGQNGWVWIRGEPEKELQVMKAIDTIEKESHKSGLTDKIKAMLGGK